MRRMVEGRRAVRERADFALRSAVLCLAIAPVALAGGDGDDDGPELAPPVTIIEGRTKIEVASAVDTVVLEPGAARVSVVARAVHVPADVATVAALFVGPLTPDQEQAIRSGKH